MGLLALSGEYYMPFLLANAAAAERGEDTFALSYDKGPYSQATFNYQVKCLMELRRRLAELEGAAAERTRTILQQTGCLDALTR
ncbi:MAG: glutathione S-transferase, partial [Rhodospirillaceae bacterium]|nr:glutathione S-transferase [Rhodospirillaceae bacterium]